MRNIYVISRNEDDRLEHAAQTALYTASAAVANVGKNAKVAVSSQNKNSATQQNSRAELLKKQAAKKAEYEQNKKLYEARLKVMLTYQTYQTQAQLNLQNKQKEIDVFKSQNKSKLSQLNKELKTLKDRLELDSKAFTREKNAAEAYKATMDSAKKEYDSITNQLR